ncbi:MAG: HAMP domain-containing histidine kinase [Planctomycetaceae bacterium]|jgi:signal transduction histidine kinase|nr:HAMP domain-containing histidine kinase [Planctomycetaceae bacterium]
MDTKIGNENNIESIQAELKFLREKFSEELERQKLDALAEFAAGAGHEINNPLAIISGHAQLLLREIENTEHRRQLAVIAAQVKRAYEMIADIRYFARPPKPEIEHVNLITWLQSLAEEQTPFMQKLGIELHVETDSNSANIETDPVQLRLVANALCRNACDILQNGGNIWLRLRQIENGWEIAVEDDGPGVAQEIRPLIFCPYYSGRQAGRGLGFGLSKAWRIMQQLGGSITYQPSETGGAKFVVRLLLSKLSETAEILTQ